jgi:crotonobetainyl-CoA:carnitine CoA-transferase CaiB-like acyl-CoA transferase
MGPRGPRAGWPGYDPTLQAYSGWELEDGGDGNPPMWARFGMMDAQCAMSSLVATLLGLYRRDQTGEGSFIAASLAGGAALTVSETLVQLPERTVAPYPKLDANQTGTGPGCRIYQTRDAWIAVAARNDREMQQLCRAAGVRDAGALESGFRERDTTPLLGFLSEMGVPAELVVTDGESKFWASADNRKIRLAVDYENRDMGRVDGIGAFWSFSDAELALERAAPAMGQHTREILAEVGYDDTEIEALLNARAAFCG